MVMRKVTMWTTKWKVISYFDNVLGQHLCVVNGVPCLKVLMESMVVHFENYNIYCSIYFAFCKNYIFYIISLHFRISFVVALIACAA